MLKTCKASADRKGACFHKGRKGKSSDWNLALLRADVVTVRIARKALWDGEILRVERSRDGSEGPGALRIA